MKKKKIRTKVKLSQMSNIKFDKDGRKKKGLIYRMVKQ